MTNSGNNLKSINYADRKTDGLIIRPLSYILCASNIPSDIYNSLCLYAKRVVKLPPFELLPKPVATHPDMIVFDTGDTLILHKEYFAQSERLFFEIAENTNRKIVLSDEIIRPEYPYDIRYNFLKIGEKVFGNAKYASSEIAKRYNIINVKQGYARCSCCKIGENAIITADKGIARKVTEQGIDALLISNGNIALFRYNYGFIGGASANVGPNEVLFFGNIALHPDYEKIKDFANKHNVALVSASDRMLYDYGGIISI